MNCYENVLNWQFSSLCERFFALAYNPTQKYINVVGNRIPLLNGESFKTWKTAKMLALGCLDLEYASQTCQPMSSNEDPSIFEKWER